MYYHKFQTIELNAARISGDLGTSKEKMFKIDYVFYFCLHI